MNPEVPGEGSGRYLPQSRENPDPASSFVKILLIRLMGLGDVASILIPAVRLVARQHPGARIHVLTHGAGGELMALVPGAEQVHVIAPHQWPGDIGPAVQSFLNIAEQIAAQGFDRVINLDTWFMPCFLATVLQELGLDVQGNTIGLPTRELFRRWQARELSQQFFEQPAHYLHSSFPRMSDWTIAWWDKYPDAGAYPDFYLRHCCGFDGAIDRSLSIEPDAEFRAAAEGRRIIALSMSGSSPSKQYRNAVSLQAELARAGHFVWSGFDGSLPLRTTLARLAVTDLLVSVATSTQWLARLVGCPTLVLPGALPPSVLGAEAAVDAVVACQYCYQSHCPRKIDFACMNVPVERVVTKVTLQLAS
jgi:ADP-heptose:LPS heptosyltransferase